MTEVAVLAPVHLLRDARFYHAECGRLTVVGDKAVLVVPSDRDEGSEITQSQPQAGAS